MGRGVRKVSLVGAPGAMDGVRLRAMARSRRGWDLEGPEGFSIKEKRPREAVRGLGLPVTRAVVVVRVLTASVWVVGMAIVGVVRTSVWSNAEVSRTLSAADNCSIEFCQVTYLNLGDKRPVASDRDLT